MNILTINLLFSTFLFWVAARIYVFPRGLGTSAYTDPIEGMIDILLTQRMMDSPEPPKVFTDFWMLAYGAME